MTHLLTEIRTALEGHYDPSELPTVAKALCCEGLGISDSDYYLRTPLTLSGGQLSWLDQALRRLQAGEPLQYVLGTAPFGGLAMHVDSRVLIPRPETAELAPLVARLPQQAAVLDVGTGSGCIAISVAKACPALSVVACDVSADALAVARSNALTAGADVRFIQADVLDVTSAAAALPRSFTCIVSNPPYIPAMERVLMERRVTDWEPSLALFVPDHDPLLFYRALARLGRTPVLAEGGWMAVEVNATFAYETAVLFTFYGYEDVRTEHDLYGKPRFVVCRK